MTILDILAGLKSGEINIDLKDHRINPIIDRIEDHCSFLQEMVEYDHRDEITKEYYQNELIREYNVGDNINLQIETYCFDCGRNHSYFVIESKSLISLNYKSYKKLGKNEKFTGICEGAEIRKDRRIKNIVNIEDGKMLIANYFQASINEENRFYEKYTRKYDLNCILGRKNIASAYADQNIGYGQMSNMSFNVFLRNDGEEVIFTDTYYYDSENDIEIQPTYEGFKFIGEIDCAVWRWEISGLKNLEKLNKKYNIDFPIEDEDNLLHLEVAPGKWEIEHYYDIMDDNEIVQNNHIFTRLKRIT